MGNMLKFIPIFWPSFSSPYKYVCCGLCSWVLPLLKPPPWCLHYDILWKCLHGFLSSALNLDVRDLIIFPCWSPIFLLNVFFLLLSFTFCFLRQFSSCFLPSHEHFLSFLYANPNRKQVVSRNSSLISLMAFFSHLLMSLHDNGLFFIKWCYGYIIHSIFIHSFDKSKFIIYEGRSLLLVDLNLFSSLHALPCVGLTITMTSHFSLPQFSYSYSTLHSVLRDVFLMPYSSF